MEITTKIDAGPQWIGRSVTCYMRLAAPKDPSHSNFYTFETQVAGLSRQADGSHILSVSLPDILRLQQKRTHLRLEPPVDYMLGLALWPEQAGFQGPARGPVQEVGQTRADVFRRAQGPHAAVEHLSRRPAPGNLARGGARNGA